MEKWRGVRGEVEDTGLNLPHDKKNTINIQQKILSVLNVRRPGKKKVRGATKRRKQVQQVWMTPCVVIQQGNNCTNVSRVEASSAYTDHRGGTQGGMSIRWREALESVHELDLVRVVEREDWSVRIPILLARLCAKEVTCTRLVHASGQAVKFGHLDGDGGNHGNIKVLIEHRSAPINPQVRRVGP